MNRSDQRGFTIVEIVLVIFITTAIAAGGWYAWSNAGDDDTSSVSGRTIDESFSFRDNPNSGEVPSGWEIFKSDLNDVIYSYAHPPDWEQSLSTYYSPSGTSTDSTFVSPDYSRPSIDVESGAQVTVSLTESSQTIEDEIKALEQNAFLKEGPELVEIGDMQAIGFKTGVNDSQTIHALKILDGEYIATFQLNQAASEDFSEELLKIAGSFTLTN